MRGFTRREFIRSAGIGALGAWSLRGWAVPPAARPNIVIILTDDLGYGDVSATGAKDVRTPNIDLLAASGMTFDTFYANCTVCSPSRAALLTGRYPDLVGVPGVIRTDPPNSWGYLDPKTPILHAVLREAGYHTAIVGKWHLGLEAPNLPTLRGVDFFKGFLGDMMEDYLTHRRQGHNYMREGDKEIDPVGHATDLFSEWAGDYLRERAKTPERPCLLYLAYNAPHMPLQPPAAWLEKVRQREPGIEPARAKLVALIEHMDDGVGRVLKVLEETGLAKNALVVFSSDNGGQSPAGRNAPFRAGKGTLYEGGLRVFGCAAWPGHIAAGSRSKRPQMLMDVFATACEAAGAKAPETCESVSFLDVATGHAGADKERTMIWPYREGTKHSGQIVYAIRRGRWKLVEAEPSKFQLFDLEADPAEAKPLGKERAEYGALMKMLREHRARADLVPCKKPA